MPLSAIVQPDLGVRVTTTDCRKFTVRPHTFEGLNRFTQKKLTSCANKSGKNYTIV